MIMLGYYFITDAKAEIPKRLEARGASFNNLSILPEIARGVLIADLFDTMGSIDIVLAEVDH